MSLEAVIQSILDKGAADRNSIISAAKKEMERTLQETREKGQLDISRRLDEASEAAEKLKMQGIARGDLESRKTVLAAQKEVLDLVKSEVLKRLGSPEVSSELVRGLLDKSEAEWRVGKVYCSRADEKLVRTIAGARFGGVIDCVGGIEVESDDGTRRIDMRFETLLQDIWEDSVKELADLLWQRR